MCIASGIIPRPSFVQDLAVANRIEKSSSPNQMFGFGAHHASAEEEKAAIKTLGERLKDGTQPVEQQLLQVDSEAVRRFYNQCHRNGWPKKGQLMFLF